MKKTVNNIQKVSKKAVSLLLSIMLVLSVSIISASSASAVASYTTRIVSEKEFYEAHLSQANVIEQGIKSGKTTFDVDMTEISFQDFAKLTKVVMNMHPEYFYFDPYNYVVELHGSKILRVIYREPYYTDYQNNEVELEEAVQDYLEPVSGSMTALTKALILHDRLIQNCTYNKDAKEDIYQTLVNGDASSRGLTLAYAYLLSRANISSEFVYSDDMMHEWLKVNIDGKYYNIDIAYDASADTRIGRVYHRYFMLSDSALKSTDNGRRAHTDFDDAYYKCTDTKYDNYRLGTFNAQLCYINGKFYTIDNNSTSSYEKCLIIYNPSNNVVTKIKKINYAWSAGNGACWVGSFMAIDVYNDILYYNTTNSVVWYNPAKATTSNVYKDNTLTGTDSYYSMKIAVEDSNVNVYVNVASSPNESGTNKKVATIAKKVLRGDANGDGTVTVSDATVIQKYLVGLTNNIDLEAADFNCDGLVNITDVSAIQKYLVS
jgi:hypothetical protein